MVHFPFQQVKSIICDIALTKFSFQMEGGVLLKAEGKFFSNEIIYERSTASVIFTHFMYFVNIIKTV